jgi:hypothetical protein
MFKISESPTQSSETLAAVRPNVYSHDAQAAIAQPKRNQRSDVIMRCQSGNFISH